MKNSHLIQRAAALALAAVMAVMTAGCGAKEQKEGATEGAKDSTKQAGTADPGTADVAKGRYVEQAVAYPFEAGTERVVDIIQDQNGELVMFTLIGQEVDGKKKAYRYDGSSWSEDTASGAGASGQRLFNVFRLRRGWDALSDLRGSEL